jgi:hypothetical protein
MNFIVVVLVLFGVSAAVAFPALRQAKRARILSFAECALPIAPAISMLVGLQVLNSAAQVGYAFIVYPVLSIVLSLILLYMRIFLLSHVRVSQRNLSIWMLTVTCLTAFVLGAVVSPWYE